MNPRKLQRVLSRGTLLLAALGGMYLWTRYEVMTLPEGGCSPLTQLAPGSFMWIDLRPVEIGVGDVLFFDVPGGRLGIGLVERVEGARYWVVTDVVDCPGESSETLGWIGGERVHGRLILAARV